MAQVFCGSTNGHRRYCYVGNEGDIYAITLYRHYSTSTPCILQHSYGQLGERYIWVEKSCRAIFRVYRTPDSASGEAVMGQVQQVFLEEGFD